MKTFPFLLLLAASVVHANDPAKTNIAKDRPYTIEPNPNYYLCTDEGDLKQLTDGKYSTGGGYWNDLAAVGWKSGGGGIATIVMDLGEYSAISKVVVSTAARESVGAYYPDIFLAVSEDGKTFSPVDVTYQKPRVSSPRDLAKAQIVLDGFLAGGRYLGIAIRNASPQSPSFMFTDEIQVFGSDLDPRTGQANTQKLTPTEWKTAIASQVSGSLEDNQLREELTRRISALPEPQAAGFLTELKAMEGLTKAELADRATRLRALIWQQQFPGARLVFWTGTPWKNFTSLVAEPSVTKEPIIAPAVQGSYGSAVVNVANVSKEPITASLELSGATEHVRVRQSIPLRTVRHQLVGDPLPLLDGKTLTIPAGEAVQLWLDIDARTLPAGMRNLTIALKDAASTTEIPIQIQVAAFDFPKVLPLKTYTWSYLNEFALTQGEFGQPAAKDLADHYVNSYVFPPKTIPRGNFDKEGRLQGPLDTAAFDRELELASFASDYFFFFGWRPYGGRDNGFFSRLEWMAPAWKTALKEWMQAWTKHLAAKGVPLDRVMFYPIDEYAGEALSEVAALIKEAVPNARVLCLPRIKKEAEEIAWIQKNGTHFDTWMPLLHVIDHQPDVLATLKKTGHPVWAYDARGPGKEMPPYGYYRLPFWKALDQGLTGYGFWSYNDAGYRTDNAWSDFDTSIGDAAVVYSLKHAPEGTSQAEPIITSRRWEAWRQGVIDYVVMDAALKKLANDPEKLAVLREQIQKVSADPENIEAADALRMQTLRDVFAEPAAVTAR